MPCTKRWKSIFVCVCVCLCMCVFFIFKIATYHTSLTHYGTWVVINTPSYQCYVHDDLAASMFMSPRKETVIRQRSFLIISSPDEFSWLNSTCMYNSSAVVQTAVGYTNRRCHLSMNNSALYTSFSRGVQTEVIKSELVNNQHRTWHIIAIEWHRFTPHSKVPHSAAIQLAVILNQRSLIRVFHCCNPRTRSASREWLFVVARDHKMISSWYDVVMISSGNRLRAQLYLKGTFSRKVGTIYAHVYESNNLHKHSRF